MSEGYVLGLDGGQSSTICVLGTTAGELLSAGHGGPANHVGQPGGPERLRSALHSSITEALTAAEVPTLTAAYLSLTGGCDLALQFMPEIVRAEHVLAES